MATINETIFTGRKFRKLADEDNKLWHRFSFWTHSSDVEFGDGITLDEKFETVTDSVDNITNKVNSLQNAVGNYKICVMTLDQYNSLTDKDNDTLYFCT